MPVYKDECVYTFDNQESPYGVDVCLTCFIGTSPDPDHDFTKYHSRVSGHTAFLNLRKIALPEKTGSEAQNEHKPKKLAIQESDDAEKFENVTEFKTLAHDNQSEFGQAIEKVMNADSYTKTQQSEAWELELQPCEHVAIHESLFDGKPPAPLSSETLSHCSQCELDKNLWICLQCGNLGCGRRHYDGSGGNGHGLQHFEEHQHPLAVKLGSITPEGHADVYCYSCNDDTKDPRIREHLSHWGIDIATHVKTEKSMTELQLEQNLNWDFSSGDKGELVTGNGFTGLKNMGNTCYLNSIMQCLFDIPEFASAFSPNDPNSERHQDPETLKVQLNKLKDGLTSGRYDVIAPQMFKYLVGKGHGEFATARQQDAFEYLSYLLTKISQNVDASLPAKIFGFQTERRISCVNCKAVRYIPEDQENISVAVPIEEISEGKFRPVEMYELLDIYTQDEEVESKCPACKTSSAISSVKFKSFPKVLSVNVRRFRIVNWVPQKVDVPVIVPSTPLSIDKYFSRGPQPDENVISNDDSAEEEEFTPDPNKLEMLQAMGFDKSLCISALKAAKERGYGEGDFEAAIEIIVGGEAEQLAASAPKKSTDVDPESRMILESMGFSTEQSEAALVHNNSNVEAAVEWLFSGGFDNLQIEDQSGSTEENPQEHTLKQLGDSTLPANYELNSVVCHKGSSVHVGHYVAAIREKGQMYLYNDEKISKGTDANELQNFAYIYMFRRV